MAGSVGKKAVVVSAMFSLVASPALAAATPPPVRSISPMVALSIFGSQASVTAFCGARASTATTSTSAASQSPATGCLLPLVDAPPPVPLAQPLAIAPPMSAVSALGISPILLGLTGIAVLAALIANSGARNDKNPPVSVN